jgi:hypothetical protein
MVTALLRNARPVHRFHCKCVARGGSGRRDGRLDLIGCAKRLTLPLWQGPLFSRLKIFREVTSIACFVHRCGPSVFHLR